MAQRNTRRLASVNRRTGDHTTGTSERITVTLIPKASATLDRLVEETGMSKTDLTNRALILYAFVMDQLEDGAELHLHDPETGKSAQVQLL